MNTHEVTIYNVYVDAVLNKEKNFEIRTKDKGYQKGDRLKFRIAQYIDNLYKSYLAKQEYEVTYVYRGLDMADNYVALGAKAVEESGNEE